MTGRRREGLAPNLFPFLAVLICTLGTLILLLALVAQNAGEAIASSTAPTASPEELAEARALVEADTEINRRLGEARWHRDQVVRMRDDQTREIDERRTRQTHLEDHVKRLHAELMRLQAEIEASEDPTRISDQSQAEVDQLKKKINEEKSKIDELKKDQDSTTRTPRIVIVPHKGPNGTDRRPIYVECRANGVYLQPGNVAIDPKYLDTDIPGPNPLDAALRTIRSYAMKNYGDIDAPYPLIVVRPDGIDTYGAARYAMKGWDDQYGYELVPEEVKLAYPEPDEALRAQVEDAIAQAVRAQQAIARSGTGRGGSGFGRNGGGGTGLTGPTGTGEMSSGPPSAGSVAASSSATGANGSPSSTAPPRRRAADLPILSARNMDATAQLALEDGYRSSGSSRSLQTQAAAQRAAAAASAKAAADEQRIMAEAGQLATQRSGTGNTNAASNAAAETTQMGDASDSTDTMLNSPIQNSAGPNRVPAGQAADAKSLANSDAFAAPSEYSSASKSPSASTDPNAPIGGTQASGVADSSNPAGTAPPPMDNNASADSPPPGSPPPPPNVKVDLNGKTPPKSLVKRGGAGWALPSDVAAMPGTAMVRMIRVECHEDRLVLLPEGGRGATNVYGFSDGNIDRASLEMATEIRDRVTRWGAAMPGGRWYPLLEVQVAPGGEFRYRQLIRLMDGSGVEIREKGASP